MAAPTRENPLDKDDPPVRDGLLEVVRRRWWLIALCAVVSAGSAWLISSAERKQYQASAQLLLRNDTAPDQSLQSVFGLPSSATAPDPTRQAATNVALVSLSTVADMTADALGHHLTGSEVGSEVAVAAVGQSDVVSINATDASPTLAVALANTFARQYIVFRRGADRSVITHALHGVQNQLKALSPQLRAGPSGQELANRVLQLSVLAGLQTGNAEVVQRATVPSSAALPKTKLNVAAGGLLGLILGIALAMVFYRFDGRAKTPEELADAYGLPVLGVVPRARELARGASENGRTVLSGPAAEAFRAVRARLRYFNLDRDLSSVLVTSASQGEGKSTTAWQLARVIAMTRKGKVLVLETDLRQPVFARAHGLRAIPGIAEVVMQSVPVEKAIQHVDVSAVHAPLETRRDVPAAQSNGHVPPERGPGSEEYVTTDLAAGHDQGAALATASAAKRSELLEGRQGWADGTIVIDYTEFNPDAGSNEDADRDGEERPRMDVVVAGAALSNPSDLLESDAMSELLHGLVHRYDFVILDAPPGPVVSDTFPLINQVSGVIIVSSLRHASRGAAKQLRSQLERVNAPMLGVVVNNAKGSHLAKPAFHGTGSIPPERSNGTRRIDDTGSPAVEFVANHRYRPFPPKGRRWNRRLVVAVSLILTAIVIAGLVMFLVSPTKVDKAARGISSNSSAVPQAARGPSTPANSTAAGRVRTGALSASPAPVHLEIVATARVWVCLEDQRGRLLIGGQIIEPGVMTDSFVSPAFRIFLGNSSVALRINGQLRSIPSSPDPVAYSVTHRGVLALPAGGAVPCA